MAQGIEISKKILTAHSLDIEWELKMKKTHKEKKLTIVCLEILL